MLLLVMIGDREIIVSAAAVAGASAFSIPEKNLKCQRSFRYNALQGPLLDELKLSIPGSPMKDCGKLSTI